MGIITPKCMELQQRIRKNTNKKIVVLEALCVKITVDRVALQTERIFVCNYACICAKIVLQYKENLK